MLIKRRTCVYCHKPYDYYPDYDPQQAAIFCSPDCSNCASAGRDPNGIPLAPCDRHKEKQGGVSKVAKEESLMKEAVKKWGIESQFNMVIEECAELIKAIQKRRRKQGSDDDVLEEGVDVELCIEQLKLILDNDIGWQSMRRLKLTCLERLLEPSEKIF